MTTTKFTKGPWKVHKTVGGKTSHITANHPTDWTRSINIADVWDDENASVIAVAPELLEVAQSILAEDMIQYLPAEYVAKVRAVISKATGGQS